MIQRSPFPIALVFPPQGHFTQPYLALPCLKAWLRANGFERVELFDASIEAYDHFLTGASLERAWERVRERLPLSRFERRSELPFAELEAFRAAAESEASAEALIGRIDAAVRTVRGSEFYDPQRYLPAIRTIYHGLRLFSAAHFPSALTPHNFTMRYAIDRSADVLAATADEEENPFLPYFREQLLPRLIALRPRLLGLSVIYGSQLVPALTLGRLVKRALPECHVTAGGGFLAYIGKKLLGARGPGAACGPGSTGTTGGRPAFDDCLDSLIFYEGEAPMLALARALQAGGDLGSVGSLGWYDRSRPDRSAVFNPLAHPIELDAAPVPDFDGLPLGKYFSPELVIPYDVNRGCYFGECTFCTLPTVIGPGYRTRRASTIADQVTQLCERHGTRNVNFITDCMPPGMLKDLPDELLARRADLRWWADARVEPKAYTEEGCRRLYESGCRKLLFGFETATPRLLKLMKKGQSARSTIEVAENCSRAGISVTFYAMVGFPTETREEARATLDFLIQHGGTIREVSLQTFHIDEVAATYREPAEFGIRILDDATADLQLYHDYEAAAGMTQAEAAEMFEEMMAALRRDYPLFAGDNLFYFMQKSHYFLHLARGTTPDEFARACRERAARRAAPSAAPDSVPPGDLRLVPLAFSHVQAAAKLGTPQARAIRPDFLTGRYVAGAEEAAARTLGGLAHAPRVLAYAPDSAEFVELRPDGARALNAIGEAGSLGEVLDGLPQDARPRFTAFAAELARLGLLVRSNRALQPAAW